jgi:thiamine-monophosphate kinase
MPLSDAMLRHVEPEQALRWALGGEDYELCFTVPGLTAALDVARPSWGAFYLYWTDCAEAEGCSYATGKPVSWI